MDCAIGLDLGGTKLSSVVMVGTGELMYAEWLQHRVRDRDTLVDTVASAVAQCRDFAHGADLKVTGVGLSIAAWTDRDRRYVRRAANLGVEDFDLGAQLECALDLPVAVENDGDATAWAEYVRGAAVTAHTLVLFALGTGVAGGIVVDGTLLRGSSGLAGELGHLPIEPDGPICICGGRGCLELYASGRALGEAAQRLHNGHGELGSAPFTVSNLVAAADAGNPAAVRALDAAANALARAIRPTIAVVDPDAVLIAGTVGHAASAHLIPALERELAALHPLPIVHRPPDVRVAALGPKAAAIGVADLVLRRTSPTALATTPVNRSNESEIR